MEDIRVYMKRAIDEGAEDIFLIAGQPVSIRTKGEIKTIDEDKLMPRDCDQLINSIYELANSKMKMTNMLEDEFSISIPSLARFRVSVFKQRGSTAAVAKIVKFGIPDSKEMHIPDEIVNLSELNDGIIIVSGPSRSGKSTTVACMIDNINNKMNKHIITIEDPIEILHRNKKSIVTQKELNTDVHTYYNALRSCLRQSPDVIFTEKLKDNEIIDTCLDIAESGHLVIATMNAIGAIRTIFNFIETFPSDYQKQYRIRLARTLKAVVSQQLAYNNEGILMPTFDIIKVDEVIKDIIKNGNDEDLSKYITANKYPNI